MSLIAEAPGFLQVFSDGTVKRFAPDIAFASPESSESYKSKDVVVDPSKPITGRIFLPNTPTINSSTHKLPVVVYFHGGGFCIGSTTWLNYHIFLGDLASLAGVIVLSIDYRLAPENRLPIAYSDGCSSLEWLVKSCYTEPWLERADLSQVFLSGDSAGGNIAHNITIKAHTSEDHDLSGIHIKGILLIHPYFGSEERTPQEKAADSGIEVQMNDMFWNLSIPKGSNRDYFGCNFEKGGLKHDEWSLFPKVVVYVAERDFLKERGVMYVEYLKRKGVRDVKLIEAKDEGHIHHIYHPKSKSTFLLQRQMDEFIKN
ncbi:probable carboxylesterase 17 [Chenopodium quinoa]|uniref:probable carboxylesterase 17 n=1 Tax=Chenopodium quinoa TaxID=63459 RepID=UPI000B77D886|nr:probable carboxylesterase 17 [Chenopodium quinoa]